MIGTVLVIAVVLAGGGIGLYRWLQFQSDRLPANAPARMVRANDVDHPTVVCIGDSITHGRTSSDYVALLQERFRPKGYRFVNAGRNGDLAYNVLQRLEAVIACRPSWITLMVGTNDVYAALSTANAHETMEQMGLPERPTREAFRRYLTEICLQLRNATAAPLALAAPAHGADEPGTEKVSVATGGTAGDGASHGIDISADGTIVAFGSAATNLVEGGTSRFDIYVRDLSSGVTEIVSVNDQGQSSSSTSLWPTISADGTRVAFHSIARNLVANDLNGTADVFVHDRTTGVTTLVSAAATALARFFL